MVGKEGKKKEGREGGQMKGRKEGKKEEGMKEGNIRKKEMG